MKSAVTDSGAGVQRGEGKEGIANLIDILSAVRGSTPDVVEAEFQGSGYGDFKGAVAEAVAEYLAPVRERYAGLAAGRGRARAGARPRTLPRLARSREGRSSTCARPWVSGLRRPALTRGRSSALNDEVFAPRRSRTSDEVMTIPDVVRASWLFSRS